MRNSGVKVCPPFFIGLVRPFPSEKWARRLPPLLFFITISKALVGPARVGDILEKVQAGKKTWLAM